MCMQSMCLIKSLNKLLTRKMGCLCSKESSSSSSPTQPVEQKDNKTDAAIALTVAPSARELLGIHKKKHKEEVENTIVVERPKDGQSHNKRSTSGLGGGGGNGAKLQQSTSTSVSKIASMKQGTKGEQIAPGWPTWLSSVASEAIQGLVPRNAESYEKLEKIGQGTYSTVYKARDLTTKKIVAMKKVRFVNMDPESVRFMAREISILRKLDHPNVMKLQAIVTSRMSGSLYLVFDYMEHDLAGLSTSPEVTFNESQIKCFMQQLIHGLEHCHTRGVLHRDIKGSNLLVDKNGILKIADFGLANTFQPNQEEPLTSRVVTLWYRAPELLLGSTDYGVGIDMWSAGCILAELFAGKPILPGRTEVEQIHKIFKLCGSPSEEFWRKSKLPHATSFKPQHPYKKNLANVFKDLPGSALALVDTLLSIEPQARGTADSALKSSFFTTKPLPCEPSSLPKLPPSKEIDAKRREEEQRRRKAESVKGRVESTQKNSRNSKGSHTPNQGQGQSNKSVIDLQRGGNVGGFTHSTSMIHHSAAKSSKKIHNNTGRGTAISRTYSSSQHGMQLKRQNSSSQSSYGAMNSSMSIYKSNHHGTIPGKDTTDFMGKRSRLLCSGPLVTPGGNMEDMLKEHERQIQEAVRKARLHRNQSKKN